MGEFGRTLKLNAQAGRDHWPRAGFVALAGGGPGGQIGATDPHGESPTDRPISRRMSREHPATAVSIRPRNCIPAGRPCDSPRGWIHQGTLGLTGILC